MVAAREPNCLILLRRVLWPVGNPKATSATHTEHALQFIWALLRARCATGELSLSKCNHLETTVSSISEAGWYMMIQPLETLFRNGRQCSNQAPAGVARR